MKIVWKRNFENEKWEVQSLGNWKVRNSEMESEKMKSEKLELGKQENCEVRNWKLERKLGNWELCNGKCETRSREFGK